MDPPPTGAPVVPGPAETVAAERGRTGQLGVALGNRHGWPSASLWRLPQNAGTLA
jgi:hypothetical protein